MYRGRNVHMGMFMVVVLLVMEAMHAQGETVVSGGANMVMKVFEEV